MRKILLFTTLILLFVKLNAQDLESERLRNEINLHPQQDTVRVNKLNQLAGTGSLTGDEIEKLADEMLTISQKINYNLGEGYAYLNLGLVKILGGKRQEASDLLKKADSIAQKINNLALQSRILLNMSRNSAANQNKEALALILKAEELALKTNDKILIADCQRNISILYQISFSDYAKAMEYALKSEATSEEADCQACLARAWVNMAVLQAFIGDQAKALFYYQKSLEINKKLKIKDLNANLLNNIGERYRMMGKYSEALATYMESLKDEKQPYRIELSESNLADVYVRMDSLPQAFHYGFSSLAIAKNIDDIEGISWISGILSRAYLKHKMPDSALYHGLNGLKAAKETGTIEFMRDNAGAVANAYAFKKDFENAYNYYNQYINYRDSMINAEVSNKSNVLTYNYDIAKKQAQITELNSQKKLQQNFLISVLVVLLLIIITAIALLRNNRQKRLALAELKQTQAQLIQSEKMASLGELTAGIAHEIQNPLNFVNNFSEINGELLKEMKDEIDKGNLADVKSLADSLIENSEKITQHGRRADGIVKGMLQHSRTGSGNKELTDINVYVDEYLRLAFHGMRSREKSFNATINTDFDKAISKINIVPQDIGRVLLNLYNNSFYSVNEKKKASLKANLPDGTTGTADKSGAVYEPVVTVSTKRTSYKSDSHWIEIKVKDNGTGIPQNKIDKIFQPFYTTKPAGQGTGLGLSLSYDILKAHGGDLKVESREGEFAEFTILLPTNAV